jgi:(E)-4-hydroxy-3-methylbut-2-enyl-diphosphate synthase
VAAYRLASQKFPYPLHLGITEAGPKDIGLIRSAAGLSPLLLEGIGDTIRISLSDEPEEEIRACKRLLHDLGLYPDYPTFISCPTCGRTQVDLIPMAKKVLAYLEDHHINKTVAIMGCIVNGPGEARHADLGMAGGKDAWVIFKKGEVIKTVKGEDAYEAIIAEINKL